MKRMHWFAVAFAAITLLGAPVAHAQHPSDVVNARANARAGGPTNAYDAWILDRYGALSGTPRYYGGYRGTSRKWRRGYRHRRRGYRH